MFTSKCEKINEFLQMGRLLDFLESAETKEAKISEIKAARNTGLIDEDEAVELTIEYC